MNTITHATLDALMRIAGNTITADRTITEAFKKGRGWRSRRVTRRVNLRIIGEGSPEFIATDKGRIAIKTLSVVAIETPQTAARKAAWKKRKSNMALRQFYAAAAAQIRALNESPLALPLFAQANAASPHSVLARFAHDWKQQGRAAVHPAAADVMSAKAATGMTWSQIARLA